MNEKYLRRKFALEGNGWPSAVVEAEGSLGVAVLLGEPLGEEWAAGQIAVFWNGGEVTRLPEEFELIVFDLVGQTSLRPDFNLG